MADTASTAPAATDGQAPMCSCGHDADAHRAGGDPAGRGCSACACTRSPTEVTHAARRRDESPVRELATELDVERHVPAPSLADALAADLELDAAFLAGAVTPAVITRAAALGLGDIRGRALLDTAARLL